MGVELFLTVRVLEREPVTTTASRVEAASVADVAVAVSAGASASAAWAVAAASAAAMRTAREFRTGEWAAGMGARGGGPETHLHSKTPAGDATADIASPNRHIRPAT